MPLTNQIIMVLNEITTNIQNKKSLSVEDENYIKSKFGEILQSGQYYDVDEVESWFDNEGSWTSKPTIVRITNMSHYIQARFEQAPKKLRMVSDDENCGCS